MYPGKQNSGKEDSIQEEEEPKEPEKEKKVKPPPPRPPKTGKLVDGRRQIHPVLCTYRYRICCKQRPGEVEDVGPKSIKRQFS